MEDLTEIDGLGNSYAERLEDAGIGSVTKLARATPEELVEAGVPETKAPGFIEQASQDAVLIESAIEAEEKQANKEFITTGMQEFDAMLQGGWEPGFLVGVAGEHESGKTQLMFQSLVAAARFHGNAIYIETEEERFRTDRIRQMVDDESTFENIYKIEAHTLEQQRRAYERIREDFDDVALVILDSFVANFRISDEFEGLPDFKARSDEISTHLQRIIKDPDSLVKTFECPFLTTLQVYGNPNQFDSSVPIWGGALMHHALTCLIFMSKSKGNLRSAELKGHPGEGDGEVQLKITGDGVSTV